MAMKRTSSKRIREVSSSGSPPRITLSINPGPMIRGVTNMNSLLMMERNRSNTKYFN